MLVPPAGLMLDGTPVSQGWRAARAVFGRRTVAATRAAAAGSTWARWLATVVAMWRKWCRSSRNSASASR